MHKFLLSLSISLGMGGGEQEGPNRNGVIFSKQVIKISINMDLEGVMVLHPISINKQFINIVYMPTNNSGEMKKLSIHVSLRTLDFCFQRTSSCFKIDRKSLLSFLSIFSYFERYFRKSLCSKIQLF